MKVLLSWIRDSSTFPAPPRRSARGCRCAASRSKGIEHARRRRRVLDFDVTANRPDCLSIRGIAREIATVYDLPLKRACRSAGSARAGLATPEPD